MSIKYSICMCNKNMANTIEIAVKSIVEQIDERFEIIIVDDNSTDKSLELIKNLCSVYSNIRYKELKYDKKRLLGGTRNECAKLAKGEYLIFQLDCDDYRPNYIQDYVKIYHEIERVRGDDFYLYGEASMTKKSFIMQYGPFKNIFFEDYDMACRMIEINKFINIKFKSQLRFPLPKTFSQSLHRILYRKSWVVLRSKFRIGISYKGYLKWVFLLLYKDRNLRTLLICIYLFIISYPAYLISRFHDPILPYIPKKFRNPVEMDNWLEKNKMNYNEIMQKYDSKADYSVLSHYSKVNI